MRTSGADEDLLLVAVPVAVLIGLSMYWIGGWRETLQMVDRAVLEVLSWVKGLWA